MDARTCGDDSQAKAALRYSARSNRSQSVDYQAGHDVSRVNEKSWQIPEKYGPYRYTLAVHGTGMADEWPGIFLHPAFDQGFKGVIEENMVLNMARLIAETSSESIRLETQALVTTGGAERMDTFPWEDV